MSLKGFKPRNVYNMNSNVCTGSHIKKKTVKPTIAGLAHVPKVTGVIIAKLDTRIETTEPNLAGTCGGSWRWSTGIGGGGGVGPNWGELWPQNACFFLSIEEPSPVTLVENREYHETCKAIPHVLGRVRGPWLPREGEVTAQTTFSIKCRAFRGDAID